ncbi:uncharacterized protein LOC125001232 [Mugil cephalus]|uniref:uncharacterized protein LOC125001232 n=1 Tax=Mugil cephalus TaxID=48193 RepID=UPI001FB7DD38|nr:uncharacterized protein LOC125001232 [Mugil cephalus]
MKTTLPLWLLLGLVIPCGAYSGFYMMGGTAVLRPVWEASINEITWTHNGDIIAYWFRNRTIEVTFIVETTTKAPTTIVQCLSPRCTLNTLTGELTISDLTLKDSGNYTAEVNNKVLYTVELKVISGVPTPTISTNCDNEMTNCVLTCEGNTTGAEPVSLTWWSSDMMKSETNNYWPSRETLMKSETNELNEEKLPFFSCKMENPVSFQFSMQIINPVLISNTDNPDISRKVGNRVAFNLSPVIYDDTINSIVWKHGSNLIVKWEGGDPVFYGDFKGRCSLNTKTGDLSISDLTLKDSGIYTAVLNFMIMSSVLDTTKLKVFSGVPTPTISTTCDDEKTHCVLTCEGNTTESEPVTYTWWSSDVMREPSWLSGERGFIEIEYDWWPGESLMKSKTKELNITKEDNSTFFGCKMENPVSSQFSKQVVNPVLISNTELPDIYKKVGDIIDLNPGTIVAAATSIVWKHGSNFIVTQYRGEPVYNGDFIGRSKLNVSTGELTISNLTLKDSGNYTAEINNKLLATTKVKVISGVPTPTISTNCDDEKTHCVLTSEGNTTDAEPVTYTWWSSDVVRETNERQSWPRMTNYYLWPGESLMESKTKKLIITKEETSSFFRCKMENPVSFQFSKRIVNPIIVFNTDNPDIYRKVGDSVVLTVRSNVTTITSIVWKHRLNFVATWDGGEPVFYGDFIGRCTLRTTTGELTIFDLTLKDSGSYTVEINGDAINITKLSVLSEVPKPSISTSCDDEMTLCVFTCEGNTTGAEPVIYSWWSREKVMGQKKKHSITKEVKEPSFICKVKNPVSSKRSEKVNNPFNNNSDLRGLIVLPILLILILVGVGVFFYKRKWKKNQTSTMSLEPRQPGTSSVTI